jgi:hypothetical protein
LSQWDIKLPMYRPHDFENLGDYFFVFGKITLRAISQNILRGP